MLFVTLVTTLAFSPSAIGQCPPSRRSTLRSNSFRMAAEPNLLVAVTASDQSASAARAPERTLVHSPPQRDLAWEIVKEECHDILEQLPLSLQRNYSLMKELDEQVTAHLQAIPAVLKDYYELRVKVEEQMATNGANASSGDAIDRPDADRLCKRPVSRASFSSASLTPISESPSTRSLSLPNVRNGGSGESNDEAETEEQDTSFETERSAVPAAPSSVQLITRIATLATDAMRGSLEKVNLANAAYAGIDRHIRALDIAIAEQEKAIEIGIRPGTHPASSTVVNGTSPNHARSPSFESNSLLALAEAATAIHAAEKTLESLQPSPISPPIKKEKKEASKKVEKQSHAAAVKPKVEPSKPKVDTSKAAKPKQQPRKDRRVGKKDPSILAIVPLDDDEPIDPNEPTYCYCNRVSFGNMIACDGPDCKREWFHYECVGITREPAANKKWYCRDCEIQEPAKKKRKR